MKKSQYELIFESVDTPVADLPLYKSVCDNADSITSCADCLATRRTPNERESFNYYCRVIKGKKTAQNVTDNVWHKTFKKTCPLIKNKIKQPK